MTTLLLSPAGFEELTPLRGDIDLRLVKHADLVPKAGLEPARLAPPPPQDGVSTNSTTSACEELDES